VESLAMGCPVVATNIPDQEFLISKSNGGIISPFEEEAFADAICKILNNSDMAAKMGESGRAFVRQYRSYKFLTNQLDKRYQALLCTET
jgi:glycosyltransferase involved in cell wall biosynthesis